jgi:hypothetical protein
MSDRHAALTGAAAPALPPEAFLALDEMEAQAHYNALAAQRIEAAIRRHMRQDLHYTYTLGGARFDKPVLLDAGIALLMRMLRLVPRHRLELALREPVPVIGPDGAIAGHRLLIKYVVRAELWHIGPDGSERLVAEGLGSASSLETRHRLPLGDGAPPAPGGRPLRPASAHSRSGRPPHHRVPHCEPRP